MFVACRYTRLRKDVLWYGEGWDAHSYNYSSANFINPEIGLSFDYSKDGLNDSFILLSCGYNFLVSNYSIKLGDSFSSTAFNNLDDDVKDIVKKHFAEGVYINIGIKGNIMSKKRESKKNEQ